jgi:hypothetical protein|eukprot:1957628-Prymnesium_polylepis.1
MSFLAKVDAVKRAVGLPPEMPALQAVGAACELMGIVPCTGSTLPLMLELVEAALGLPSTGAAATATTAATAATADESSSSAAASAVLEPPEAATAAARASTGKGKAAAPAAAPRAKPSAPLCGKRKAEDAPSQPPSKATKQTDIRCVASWKKLFVPKKMLEAAAAASST